MKNNKNAFTFVEILFVISIISFLTFSSVMYFNNFVDRKKIDGDIYLIKSSFEELDSKVKNNEIYDYEIKFSGKLYYLLRLNQVINPTKINFSMNEDTKNFNMTTNLTNPGIWDIKTYIVDKVLDVKSIDQQGVFT
jgi:Tfp pilus assembly protein PilE